MTTMVAHAHLVPLLFLSLTLITIVFTFIQMSAVMQSSSPMAMLQPPPNHGDYDANLGGGVSKLSSSSALSSSSPKPSSSSSTPKIKSLKQLRQTTTSKSQQHKSKLFRIGQHRAPSKTSKMIHNELKSSLKQLPFAHLLAVQEHNLTSSWNRVREVDKFDDLSRMLAELKSVDKKIGLQRTASAPARTLSQLVNIPKV